MDALYVFNSVPSMVTHAMSLVGYCFVAFLCFVALVEWASVR
jgi:hypothetical protein